MIPVNDLRQGVVFKQDGSIYLVEEFQRHKMARAKGVVNLKVRDIESGSVQEMSFKSNDRVEEADLENKKLEFVYRDERKGKLIFSDPETKQRVLTDENLLSQDERDLLTEGVEILAKVGREEGKQLKIYTLTLPNVVELRVAQAPPAERGNTSASGTKPVKVETGATVNTPFFIKVGDVIKVNTQTREYIGRAE